MQWLYWFHCATELLTADLIAGVPQMCPKSNCCTETLSNGHSVLLIRYHAIASQSKMKDTGSCVSLVVAHQCGILMDVLKWLAAGLYICTHIANNCGSTKADRRYDCPWTGLRLSGSWTVSKGEVILVEQRTTVNWQWLYTYTSSAIIQYIFHFVHTFYWKSSFSLCLYIRK